ncbi:hypothetical protein [Endozoicomonas ascidiicola]|uniref:hypothetical protein n=1 Tax=Endozoicomonas ascidiicola TaxID=1698521 RepID=UPI0008313F6A|nr:hypothetical protein [Endozoicomonas ascidiicola]
MDNQNSVTPKRGWALLNNSQEPNNGAARANFRSSTVQASPTEGNQLPQKPEHPLSYPTCELQYLDIRPHTNTTTSLTESNNGGPTKESVFEDLTERAAQPLNITSAWKTLSNPIYSASFSSIPEKVFQSGPAQLPRNPAFDPEGNTRDQNAQARQSSIYSRLVQDLYSFARENTATDLPLRKEACYQIIQLLKSTYPPDGEKALMNAQNLLNQNSFETYGSK